MPASDASGPAARLPGFMCRESTPAGADPPIRVGDPAELVATVPALLGFHPRESLVLLATGGPSGLRIGLTLRVDLPPPRHRAAVAADAVRTLLLDRPAGAIVIVISERAGRRNRPPHAELVDAVAAGLVRQGVEPHTLVWAATTAAGAPWACYDPCGCSGVLPDPATTVFAAAVVANGQVIHPNRAAMARLVAPSRPERLARRERLLAARLEAEARCPEAVTDDPHAGLALIDAAIAAAEGGGPELDDRTAVELACALNDTSVRDAALLRNVGPTAEAAERLWTTLARELPDPEAAEPAALLAVSALLRGHGALANVALDRAERAWPGHRLTGLLRRAAQGGVRPDQLRAWLVGEQPHALDPTGRAPEHRPPDDQPVIPER